MGYCLDPPALMFEYMERGSLYDNLHGVCTCSHVCLEAWSVYC